MLVDQLLDHLTAEQFVWLRVGQVIKDIIGKDVPPAARQDYFVEICVRCQVKYLGLVVDYFSIEGGYSFLRMRDQSTDF